MNPQTETSTQKNGYDIVIDGIDHVEIYVSNALQAPHNQTIYTLMAE